MLANLYLHWFDKRFHQKGGPAQFANARIIRYAEATAEDWMGLTINRDKTTIVNLCEPKAVLHFLGYSYRYDKDLRGWNKRYLNLFPSNEACARRREKVRQQLNPRTSYVPIPELIDRLNQQLAGWAGYYSKGYPRKSYRDMNQFVQLRLIKHLKRRSQRPYRPRKGETWYQLPLWKFRFGTIIADFSDSNDEKTIGKPDAGKLHVRFDEGEQTSGVLLVCFLLYW